MSHNFERLKEHILPLSVATDFDVARKEWALVDIEISEEFDHCPCGKEIKEHCYIRNRLNNAQTYVGNVCIQRFIGLDTATLFAGMKRIIDDDTAKPNADLIAYADDHGYLYGEKEYKFLDGIKRKRNLSTPQLVWLQKINRRITEKIVVRKRSLR